MSLWDDGARISAGNLSRTTFQDLRVQKGGPTETDGAEDHAVAAGPGTGVQEAEQPLLTDARDSTAGQAAQYLKSDDVVR